MSVVNLDRMKLVKTAQLVKAVWNYKEDNADLAAKLAENIKRNGQIENILIRELDTGFYEVVNGNHRYDALKLLGVEEVIAYDLGKISTSHAMRIAVETNETRFESNDERLRKVLGEIAQEFTMDDLAATMPFNDAQLAKMFGAEPSKEPIEEPPLEIPAAQFDTFAKRGDVYQLGPHRLMCGDSTEAADLNELLAGEKAACIFTDPPYAIYGSSTGIASDITDDKMVRPFFRDIIRNCANVLKPFGHAYLCCDWRSWASWWEVAKASGMTPKNMIVWDKGGGLGAMFANAHELIFFASFRPMREAMTQKISGERTVNGSNVWRINRAGADETGDKRVHNAQKPVELVTKGLEVSTDPGDLVVDFFLGSGTTLIAADSLGRRCFGMELEPKYCEVIIRRWLAFRRQRSLPIEGCTLNGEPLSDAVAGRGYQLEV